jgi:hypothetical protein
MKNNDECRSRSPFLVILWANLVQRRNYGILISLQCQRLAFKPAIEQGPTNCSHFRDVPLSHKTK